MTFAKTGTPNSRTTQFFINAGNNSRLDGMGFTPFGKVLSGMAVVDSFYGGYGEEPLQEHSADGVGGERLFGRGVSQARFDQEGDPFVEEARAAEAAGWMKSAFFSPGSVKSKPQPRKNSSDDVTTITSRMFRFRASSTQAVDELRAQSNAPAVPRHGETADLGQLWTSRSPERGKADDLSPGFRDKSGRNQVADFRGGPRQQLARLHERTDQCRDGLGVAGTGRTDGGRGERIRRHEVDRCPRFLNKGNRPLGPSSSYPLCRRGSLCHKSHAARDDCAGGGSVAKKRVKIGQGPPPFRSGREEFFGVFLGLKKRKTPTPKNPKKLRCPAPRVFLLAAVKLILNEIARTER